MTNWEKKEAKRDWQRRNPDKVRQANKDYRRWNQRKTNEQARVRMQRYRARLKRLVVPATT